MHSLLPSCPTIVTLHPHHLKTYDLKSVYSGSSGMERALGQERPMSFGVLSSPEGTELAILRGNSLLCKQYASNHSSVLAAHRPTTFASNGSLGNRKIGRNASEEVENTKCPSWGHKYVMGQHRQRAERAGPRMPACVTATSMLGVLEACLFSVIRNQWESQLWEWSTLFVL